MFAPTLRPPLSATALAAVLLALGAAACSSGSSTPATGVTLKIAHPDGDEDNPFGLAGDKFVAITAEVPGKADSVYQKIVPYTPGMNLDLNCASGSATCDGITYGTGQQVRVEVWSSAGGQPQVPLGRGRSIPYDAMSGGSPKPLTPYVTRMNRFAPAVSKDGAADMGAGRAGTSAVTLPGNEGFVVIAGGATPNAGAKKAFDPASYGEFSDSVAVYDPNTRELKSVSQGGPEYALKTARAFHASASGKSTIVIAGGYVAGAAGPKITNTVEYIDKNFKVQTSPSAIPDLKFARAGATAVQMFPTDDFFLIMGGKGDTPCKDDKGNDLDCAGNTWELWHPINGNLAQGRLNSARWNHAATVIPGAGGGYVMLIGGENDEKVHDTFEVIQFTSAGGGVISNKGQGCRSELFGGKCDAFLWEPLTQGMPVARTMPGAAYVSVPRGSANPTYRYVYIVGGFTDKDHTKALARFDVFDVGMGNYINADGFALSTPRGAPMVAAVPQPTTQGQILVAGGSASDTIHLSTAEFIYVHTNLSPLVAKCDGSDPACKPCAEGQSLVNNQCMAPTIQVPLVENDLPGGGRSLGQAITLNTGHVLLFGGVGTTPEGLIGQSSVTLWNPQY